MYTICLLNLFKPWLQKGLKELLVKFFHNANANAKTLVLTKIITAASWTRAHNNHSSLWKFFSVFLKCLSINKKKKD